MERQNLVPASQALQMSSYILIFSLRMLIILFYFIAIILLFYDFYAYLYVLTLDVKYYFKVWFNLQNLPLNSKFIACVRRIYVVKEVDIQHNVDN